MDTSQDRHDLDVTSSPNGLVFECRQGCGRRLAVDRAGRLTVLDRGEPWALHSGSIGGVEGLRVGVDQT
jgi:hypothetical protein